MTETRHPLSGDLRHELLELVEFLLNRSYLLLNSDDVSLQSVIAKDIERRCVEFVAEHEGCPRLAILHEDLETLDTLLISSCNLKHWKDGSDCDNVDVTDILAWLPRLAQLKARLLEGE